jgi:hypothetical protein
MNVDTPSCHGKTGRVNVETCQDWLQMRSPLAGAKGALQLIKPHSVLQRDRVWIRHFGRPSASTGSLSTRWSLGPNLYTASWSSATDIIIMSDVKKSAPRNVLP